MKKGTSRLGYLWLTLAGLFFLLCIIIIAVFLRFSSLQKELKLTTSIDAYVGVQEKKSPFVSREWMNLAITIVSEKNLSGPVAARLYAYTASVFSDVLTETGSTDEASQATARMLHVLQPEHAAKIDAFFTSVASNSDTLSSNALKILAQYETRAKSDGFDLIWTTAMIPNSPDGWYVQGMNRYSVGALPPDTGAMSGEWARWILPELSVEIPPPPKKKSLADMIDMESAVHAIDHRESNDIRKILFWNGVDNLDQKTRSLYFGQAGVWQNIFSVEKGADLSEMEYAKAQKILAETIADAAGYSWKIKYTYYRQRPSMRIQNLETTMADSPSPGYISDDAAVSISAAAVLSALFPEKAPLWRELAQESARSVLLAGSNFKSDVEEGVRYGDALSSAILKKLKLPAVTAVASGEHSFIENTLTWLALTIVNRMHAFAPQEFPNKIRTLFSHIAFEEASHKANIPVSRSNFAAWGDYDNDGFPDLIVNSALYKNKGDGTFSNLTNRAGLSKALQGTSAFGDMNGDGCEDVIGTKQNELLYYENDCNGVFISKGRFVSNRFGGAVRGIALMDYDGDGDLDLYTVSYDLVYFDMRAFSRGKPIMGKPNVLWRNDGNGVFTDVTLTAGVGGVAQCSQFPQDRYVKISLKASFQPIWFDYNNDGKTDLYIATDSGVSPLYRNNGDGTFTDVTDTAGLCSPRTGMGVAVGDVDANGYSDIYVTNLGANFLWMNHEDGTFTEEAIQRNATDLGQGWGTVLSDFDNDGDMDIYIANAVLPNYEINVQEFVTESFDFGNADSLYENDGTAHFYPVSLHAGISDSDLTHQVAAADYDNDGRMDLYVGATGHPAGKFNALYHNISKTGNHWITLKLKGTHSNTDGVGSVVIVVAGGKKQMLDVVEGSSFFSENSVWPHFGLGKSKKIDSITVRWPSGTVQTLNDIAVDQILNVVEP